MRQRIQFATAEDGVRIAYAATGQGMPLVHVPGWVSHLELEPQGPSGEFYERLGRSRLLIRYDSRGTGLSDRNVDDVSLHARLKDLRAVVEHLRLERFALFAWSHGTPTAIVYTAEYPERVSHLILYAPFCEGYAKGQRREALARALVDLMRAEWGVGAKATMGFVHPDADREQEQAFLSYARESCSGDVAARILEEGMFHTDVGQYLSQITAPTLVMHRRDDNAIPLEFGRRVASLLPNARFLPLEGSINLPFQGDTEPLLSAIDEFLGSEAVPSAPGSPAVAGSPLIILFTDMEGSTTLTQRLGDAKAQDVLRTHNRIVRDALRAHGGSETKHTGDGIMASFPSASRALECAVAAQRALASHNDASPEAPIRVRIGLNAGEPVAEEEDLFGTAVQVAARVCAQAEPGQILAANVVRELAAGKGFLFSDRGDVALRGFEDPVRLYEVRWQE